jgi:heterotetrameric sarcosine oxidase delta subunit
MGATAASHLLRRYDALEGRTFVILGSGREATALAEALRSSGRAVAAIVEAAQEAIDSASCARLAASGVKILVGAMVRRALGSDSVAGASIVRLDDAQSESTIACDTIVLETGSAPAIELFDIAGAAIVFRSESGGHVPLVDADGRTTEPMLFGAGDCLGIEDDPPAAAEGVRAARAAAAALPAGPDADWTKPVIEAQPAEQAPSPRLLWATAARTVAEADTHVCQCEEVSLDDLLGVRPPHYLHRDQPAQRARDLASLAAEVRINQDQVKRLTRAGMGLCQGRRCREQVAPALAEATGVALSAIPLLSCRAPVRPLPITTFADESEQPAMAEHWDTWVSKASGSLSGRPYPRWTRRAADERRDGVQRRLGHRRRRWRHWAQRGLVARALIPCPFCGARPEDEFHYRGDAGVERPAPDAGEQAFYDYVYTRINPRGWHSEWWHHYAGCRQWLKVERNTLTHEIRAAVGPAETLPPTRA